jgi:hypothetical protein
MSRIRITLFLVLFFLASCSQQESQPQGIQFKNMSNPDLPDIGDELIKEEGISTQELEVFPLYITDFQARWNAISEEQTGDLYIQQLEKSAAAGHYLTSLKEKLHMEIQTAENNQISTITIRNTGTTNLDLIKMLTSWWQVLIITNPQLELHEIDAIFAEIGIRPNTNFEELKETIFTFGGLNYKVVPTKGHMVFEVHYPHSDNYRGGN